MNPFEFLIQRLLENAEAERVRRNMTERLFLFGIEIGQGKPLTSQEKLRYAKTFSTARYAMGAEEKVADDAPQRPAVEATINQTLDDWLKRQPELKKTLEEWFGEEIDDNPAPVTPEEYQEMKTMLRDTAIRSGLEMSDDEIDQLLQKLLYPFDRP